MRGAEADGFIYKKAPPEELQTLSGHFGAPTAKPSWREPVKLYRQIRRRKNPKKGEARQSRAREK